MYDSSEENHEAPKIENRPMLHREKILLTVAFTVSFINTGLAFCVYSSTLPDWISRIGTDNEGYGRMMLVATLFTTLSNFIFDIDNWFII